MKAQRITEARGVPSFQCGKYRFVLDLLLLETAGERTAGFRTVDTGDLKWHYQMVPGDSWDFDSVQQLMLADFTINGRQRKVIMQANKNGFYYVLDRVTGAFISAQPFAQVTWAKGIDQETGRPIINPEAHYDHNDETVSISPGPGGAHNWSPMSFNPNTGLVYIPSSYSSFPYQAQVELRPDRQR